MWHRKLAFHIPDVALFGACALYQKRIPLPDFHMDIIRGFLEVHKERSISWTDHHVPDYGPSIPCQLNALKWSLMLMPCVINSIKRKGNHYICSECHVVLFVVWCFEQFHTQNSFVKIKECA
jgi:hypothetical protein